MSKAYLYLGFTTCKKLFIGSGTTKNGSKRMLQKEPSKSIDSKNKVILPGNFC
jgi:hypothetical protein